LSKVGLYEEAATQLRKAVEIDPQSLVGHYNLASVLARLGDFAGSLEHYDTVLAATPTDRSVRRQRADVLRQASRLDEALKCLEELLAEDADDEPTYLDLSDLLVARAEYRRAIELLDKAVAKFPERGLSGLALAKLLATCPDLSLRNGAKAVALATVVVQAQQTPQHLEALAVALAEAGRCDEAAKIQQQLVDLAVKLENEELAARLKVELVRYQAGKPCRPASQAAVPPQTPAAETPAQDERPATDGLQQATPGTDSSPKVTPDGQ